MQYHAGTLMQLPHSSSRNSNSQSRLWLSQFFSVIEAQAHT
jgi:hypothetical protein